MKAFFMLLVTLATGVMHAQSLNFVWAKRLGGTSEDVGATVVVDGSGSVYITGYFRGTVDFDPGAGTFNLTASGSSSDIFVSKLNSSGTFVWAKRIGGIVEDLGISIAVDGLGNVYTTGYFKGTADFDPGSGTFNLTASGSSSDIFVSKLNSSGGFVWARKMGGTTDDGGLSIALDGSGNVYTTGYFTGTADFDPGAGTFNLTAGGPFADIFVEKLNESGSLSNSMTNDLIVNKVQLQSVAETDQQITHEAITKRLYVFPNPVLDLLNVQVWGIKEAATVQIIDAFGRIVKQERKNLNYSTFISIDVKSLQKGTYFLVLYHKDNKEVQVFTKQ